jgi:hypothetical protein
MGLSTQEPSGVGATLGASISETQGKPMRAGSIIRQLPTRTATGAFILNSGLSKWRADDETAKHVHEMARDAYPFLDKIDPRPFTKALGALEMAIGGTLLAPFVPEGLAGTALVGFSGGLLGLYLRLPGMREPGGIRPTQRGTPLAKDSWMLGIGTSLLLESLGNRLRRRARARAA